jgi:PAS domain S-box-containing protein
MTGACYAEWRYQRSWGHFFVSVPVVAFSSVLCYVGNVVAATGEPVPREFYDHPLLFLCIILLLCAIIIVLHLNRQKLQSSERQYRALFADNGAVMLLIEPATMKIMDANPAACSFYGWSPEELLNMRITDINTLPESEVDEIFLDVLNHEKRRFLARHRLASGEVRDVEVNSMPYRIEERQCLLSIIHDITLQVVAEQKLEQTRQQTVQELVQARDEWARTFDAVPDLIAILDTDYRIVRVNRTMAEKLGISPAEVTGKHCYEYVHGTMKPPTFCPNSVLLRDRLEHVEEVYEEKLGGWFHLTVTPVHDSEGQFLGSVHVARDINKRIQAEELLRESEERYRLIAEHMSDIICVHAPDGTYTFVSPSVTNTLGYDYSEMLGKTPYDFIHPDDIATVLKPYHEAAVRGEASVSTLEIRNRTKDGRWVWLESVITPVLNDRGEVVWGLSASRDITARKEAERALRESEEKYRLIYETTLEGIFQTTPAGRYLNVNPAFARILGYDSPEELAIAIADIGVQLYVDPEQRAEIKRQLAEGAVVKGFEAQLRHKDGGTIWALINAAAVRADSGEILYYQGGMIDITERKLAQERILASLREKEMLLKEIHHRVKNNLQIVSSLLNLQIAHIDDKKLIPLFRESQNRVRTMALIHEKLYRSDNLAYIDFGAYLRDLANSLFRSYHSNVPGVRLNIDAEPITFGIDTAVPCGLLLNELISNALKYAFPDGRKGTVRIEFHQNDEKTCTLIVADTGVGLPDDFDIQQTETLGMELIRSLTKQLDGTLDVGNDGGARFAITFKRQD